MKVTESEALLMVLELAFRMMGLTILIAEATVSDGTAREHVRALREWYWSVQDEMDLAEQIEELKLGESEDETRS